MNTILLIRRRRRQIGLSLVELMVAMTIGLFIAGFISAIYISSKQSSRYQDAMARLQENARFAMNLMSRSVRNAGYSGCGSASVYANVVTGGESNWWLNLSSPLVGYEGGVSTFPRALSNAIANTDALVAVGVDDSDELSVISHNPNSAQINTTVHSVRPGTIMVITDCSHTAVFQMSGPTNNNNNATNVVHNTGNSITPGNCYKKLGASCSATAKEYTFQPGSILMKLSSNAFYVGNSSAGGGRSLWSAALVNDAASGDATASAVELVEGVDDMQIEYGEDTDQDGVPNKYVVASSVTAWPDVVTARISLLMSTAEDNIALAAQTYEYNNQRVTASDRRVRRVYTSVVALRNRSQ